MPSNKTKKSEKIYAFSKETNAIISLTESGVRKVNAIKLSEEDRIFLAVKSGNFDETKSFLSEIEELSSQVKSRVIALLLEVNSEEGIGKILQEKKVALTEKESKKPKSKKNGYSELENEDFSIIKESKNSEKKVRFVVAPNNANTSAKNDENTKISDVSINANYGTFFLANTNAKNDASLPQKEETPFAKMLDFLSHTKLIKTNQKVDYIAFIKSFDLNADEQLHKNYKEMAHYVLLLAIITESFEVVRALLKQGADLIGPRTRMAGMDGKAKRDKAMEFTAFYVAAKCGNVEIFLEALKNFLEKGGSEKQLLKLKTYVEERVELKKYVEVQGKEQQDMEYQIARGDIKKLIQDAIDGKALTLPDAQPQLNEKLVNPFLTLRAN